MIEIKQLCVKSSGYSNTLVVRFADDNVVAKKRSCRGTLEVTHTDNDSFVCQLNIQPNTTGRRSINGEVLVHKAYKGQPGEWDITFAAPPRFGGKLLEGDYHFQDLGDGKFEFAAEFKDGSKPEIETSQPDASQAIADALALVFSNESSKADIQAAFTKAIKGTTSPAVIPVTKPAKEAKPAKAKTTNRGNKLSDDKILRIRRALKHNKPSKVAELLGVALSTVYRYAE